MTLDADGPSAAADRGPAADGLLPYDQVSDTLANLSDLHAALDHADPKVRRQVYDAFRLTVEIDRNASQVRLKALVSSAFSQARDLGDPFAPVRE